MRTTTSGIQPGTSAGSAHITEPALLIRINQSYSEGMSALALYEATRGVWVLGPRRERAQIALAVHRGVVLEVYEIHDWHPGISTPYQTRTFPDPRARDRWEFTGAVAVDAVRQKYVGTSVADYLKRGNQNPVVYVNVE
jgi:hypothetical protein